MRYLCHKIDTVDKKLFLRKAKEKDRDTFFYLFYKSGLENKNDLDSQELYKISVKLSIYCWRCVNGIISWKQCNCSTSKDFDQRIL